MLFKKFSVFDSKANAYLPDFEQTTTALAIRAFATAANKEDHDFHTYAADYTLFETGTRDDATGLYTNLEANLNLGTALSHIDQMPAVRQAIHEVQSNYDRKESK